MNRAEADTGQLMRYATWAAVAVAFVLVATKAIAWWLSGSVAMLGSLSDSFLDMASSVVTLFAVRAALIPADDDHRFGHGKAEALAGLFQASVMTVLAILLVIEALHHLLNPQSYGASEYVIGVSALAVLLSFGLVMFQSHVVKKSGSIAIAGDRLHYTGDLLLNIGVIGSAIIAGFGFLYVDSIFAILVTLYILHGAWEVAHPAIDMLMDKEMGVADERCITDTVLAVSGVMAVHHLKTRASGRDLFIQMHIEVDSSISVREGHDIAEKVENAVAEAYSNAEILIHVDPAE